MVRMAAFLAKVDAKILEFVQTIYLWVFDRTGMLVGVAMFLVGAASYFLSNRGVVDLGLVFALLIPSIWGFMEIWMQSRGPKMFNACSLGWQKSYFRIAAIGLDAGFLISSIIRLDATMAVAQLLGFVWTIYLPAIQVRDREPPEKRAVAPQASS